MRMCESIRHRVEGNPPILWRECGVAGAEKLAVERFTREPGLDIAGDAAIMDKGAKWGLFEQNISRLKPI